MWFLVVSFCLFFFFILFVLLEDLSLFTWVGVVLGMVLALKISFGV